MRCTDVNSWLHIDIWAVWILIVEVNCYRYLERLAEVWSMFRSSFLTISLLLRFVSQSLGVLNRWRDGSTVYVYWSRTNQLYSSLLTTHTGKSPFLSGRFLFQSIKLESLSTWWSLSLKRVFCCSFLCGRFLIWLLVYVAEYFSFLFTLFNVKTIFWVAVGNWQSILSRAQLSANLLGSDNVSLEIGIADICFPILWGTTLGTSCFDTLGMISLWKYRKLRFSFYSRNGCLSLFKSFWLLKGCICSCQVTSRKISSFLSDWDCIFLFTRLHALLF